MFSLPSWRSSVVEYHVEKVVAPEQNPPQQCRSQLSNNINKPGHHDTALSHGLRIRYEIPCLEMVNEVDGRMRFIAVCATCVDRLQCLLLLIWLSWTAFSLTQSRSHKCLICRCSILPTPLRSDVFFAALAATRRRFEVTIPNHSTSFD